MIGIAVGADPQEVFLNVIAAARAELDVVNMGPGPSLADLTKLPEMQQPKALDRPRIHNARRRAWVRVRHVAEGGEAHPVGQNTQQDAQRPHAATPAV